MKHANFITLSTLASSFCFVPSTRRYCDHTTLVVVMFVCSLITLIVIYASAPLGGANAYMFYSLFFLLSVFFSVCHNEVHKYETTVLGNG